MRHLKAGRRLGVDTAHRRAMMRNMVTSLIEHGQITCTMTRAKEARSEVDHMIGLAKRGDLHAKRQALRFIQSKDAFLKLFGELGERYKDRQGGYTRIIRLGDRRLGDGAEMVIWQLIGSENDVLSTLKKKKKKKPAAQAAKGGLLAEVNKEIVAEAPASTGGAEGQASAEGAEKKD